MTPSEMRLWSALSARRLLVRGKEPRAEIVDAGLHGLLELGSQAARSVGQPLSRRAIAVQLIRAVVWLADQEGRQGAFGWPLPRGSAATR